MRTSRFVPALVLVGMVGTLSSFSARSDDKVDLSNVKVNGLIQAWIVNDTTAPTGTGALDFRFRRAEIRFSSNITPDFRWFVMIDPAKKITVPVAATNDNKILQDLGVGVKICPDVELIVGQMKILTDAEGLEKSSELLLPERSLSGRTFGDKREPGGQLIFKKDSLQVGLMASNGQATNVDDTTSGKDLSLRVDVDAQDWLRVGAFTLASDNSYGNQARFGANVRANYQGAILSSEFVTNKVGVTGVRSDGFHVTGAYSLTESWQPVARYEFFKPNTDLDATGIGVSLGLNYLISKHNAKIQAAYEIMTNMAGTLGSPAYSAAGVDGGQLTISLQAAI